MKTKVKTAMQAIPRPLIVSLALAFPLWPGLAAAAPTVAASGAFEDQAGFFFADTQKSGSFDQPATPLPFSAVAFGAPASIYDTSTSLVARTVTGGYFGGSSLNNKIYGSAAPMTSNVRLVFADSILNNSASAQNVNFGIAISKLQIDVQTGSLRDMAKHTNIASFAANVYVGASNTPIWSSSFAWDSDIVTTSGTDIGMLAAYNAMCTSQPSYGTPCIGTFRQGSFGIQDYTTNIALGALGANQTLGVRYEIDLRTETNTYGGVASINFNDPAGLAYGGSNGPASARLGFAPLAPVPEPETYLMMAAGLGMLAATRRRRRSR